MLKWLLRIVGLMMLLLIGAVAWWYRDPILHGAARWLGPRRTALPPVTDTAVGAPTPSAVAAGNRKVTALKRRIGPDSVVLSPNEVAALIGGGIDWSVRKTFDSLRVELRIDTLVVYCRLDTRALPPGALGPFEGMFRPYEPLLLAGPVRIERPGVARWTIAELSLRGFEFPGPLVKQLARQTAGADSAGAVPVKVDSTIERVVIHPTGVVLYRRRRA